MSMIKIFSPSGWGFDEQIVTPIKIASDGLRGTDRRNFIKRASGSESLFLPFLDQIKFAEDEEPIHILAVGADEAWGGNRNGDSFTEQMCKECHDTFVKYAKFFRSHKNKPAEGDLHYGRIKMSAYNPVMRRIELLGGLFKTAEAAEKYGGAQARMADREMQKLASGKDLAVSMACRVPYDECSMCHNKARTRDEYCKEASCAGGGCFDNLTRLVKQGRDTHHMRVYNHRPSFFDLSAVFRPAERTAYAGTADYLTKMADDHGFSETYGAKLASDLGMVAPLGLILEQDIMVPGEWDTRRVEQIKLAHGLAALEKRNEDTLPVQPAFMRKVQPAMPLEQLGLDPTQPMKMAAALGALADEKIVMPMRDFAAMTKRAELDVAATSRLPNVYTRMLADGSLETHLSSSPYIPVEKLASAAHRKMAKAAAEHYSLEPSAVSRRTVLAMVRERKPDPAYYAEKMAADGPAAEGLARDYAVYKLAALQRIARFDTEFPLTCRLSYCQNQVS